MTSAGGKVLEFRRSWPLLLAASVGNAVGLSSILFYSLGSFIGPLQAEFGWSRGDVASSFLYTTAVLALISPGLGILIDRIGVRQISLISIPLLALVLFAVSRFEGSTLAFHGLYALAALVGGGTTPIAYTRVVNGAFKEARGLALGISLAGVAIAAMTLPLILAGINQSYGWRTSYLALAVLVLLAWPLVLFGIKDQEKLAVSRQAAIVDKSVLRSTIFWTLGISFVAIAVAVSAMIVHMVPMLRDAGVSPMVAASVASLIGVGGLVGRLATGYLIDRFFAPYVAATLFLATAAGCLLLWYGGSAVAPVVAAATGLSLGAEIDLMAYLTARYFGMARYGFVYALIYAMFAVGTAVGPALAGVAFDSSGNYNMTIWSATALLVIGSAALLRLPRFENREAH